MEPPGLDRSGSGTPGQGCSIPGIILAIPVRGVNLAAAGRPTKLGTKILLVEDNEMNRDRVSRRWERKHAKPVEWPRLLEKMERLPGEQGSA